VEGVAPRSADAPPGRSDRLSGRAAAARYGFPRKLNAGSNGGNGAPKNSRR
jgi:hypothetical protein